MAPFTIGGVRVPVHMWACMKKTDDSRWAQRDSYFHQNPPITLPLLDPKPREHRRDVFYKKSVCVV